MRRESRKARIARMMRKEFEKQADRLREEEVRQKCMMRAEVPPCSIMRGLVAAVRGLRTVGWYCKGA